MIPKRFSAVTDPPSRMITLTALFVWLLIPVALAGTKIWNGAGGDTFWNNANNWISSEGPEPGDDLVFPSDAIQLETVNDFAGGTTFNSITASGEGYTFDGNEVVLECGINCSNGTFYFAFPIKLNATQTVSCVNGTNSISGNIDTGGHDLIFSGHDAVIFVFSGISGSGGVIIDGDVPDSLYWEVELHNPSTFTGPIDLRKGFLEILNGQALGSDSASLNIHSGGIFEFNVGSAISISKPLNLSGLVTSIRKSVTWTGPVTLSGNATIQLLSTNPFTINAGISGTGGFTKSGFGVLTLNSNNSYTGTTTVSDGTLVVNGAQPSSAIILTGGTLGGTGTVGAITSSGTAAKTIHPGSGPGIFNSGNVAFNSSTTFSIEVNGSTPGSGYGQLNVTGPVSLSSAILALSLGFSPAVGDSFLGRR